MTSESQNTLQPLRAVSTKYKDYLSEQRKVKHDDKMRVTGDSRLRDRSMMREVEQACKMASEKDKEGLERLQYVASKL